MRKELINKSNIDKFSINSRDRRNIRDGKVKELIAQLKTGQHFSSPFVINEVEDKWRLIDGNHRQESIKHCISEDKSFEIVIWMAVYKNLSIDEEREVYSLWNKGVTQTSTDFLKAHFETVSMGKEMIRRLPVTIYGDKQHLPIKSLVGCQIDAKKHKKFNGSYSGGREETIADFQAVTPDDVDLVEEFCDFMENCFGKYDKKNNSQFYQTTPLSVFYRIWFDNQDISKSNLVKIFIRIFAKDPKKWESFTKSGGRSASQSFYRVAIPTLNGISSMHIKNDEEAIDNYEKEMQIITVVKPSKK